ncbi:MAG: glycosyltransferase family 4 protein [Telmatospirillum sp.]|nr:glycosyltransferase family 4 protein [Telmatospirillum sp.]
MTDSPDSPGADLSGPAAAPGLRHAPAHVVMSDDGITFDGRVKDQRPLGGAESAFAELAEALSARGHRVEVHCRCDGPLEWKGVRWTPLDDSPSQGIPDSADLYIANRSNHLIGRCPGARARVFWIHNPAGYLLKARYQWPLLRHRPAIVFSGASHLSTYPGWAFGGRRVIIPYGITPLFLGAAPRATVPPPRAIFLSNPLRSLDWLLDVWSARIQPAVPGAELHIFAGSSIYGAAGAAKADRMAPILERAAGLSDKGVILRGPVAKRQLVEEIAAARVFLYRGDIGETFCNAAAEPQAMGLPGVVEDIACMRERVVDGETGFVVMGEAAFAEAARRLLTDDGLWLNQHREALDRQGRWTWSHAAAGFETLMA